MADNSSKPDIPTWQRNQQSPPAASSTSHDKSTAKTSRSEPSRVTEAATEKNHTSIDDISSEESAPPSEGASQLEMVEAFLSDPSVKQAPLAKKRSFLESKSVPVETIDKVLPESNGCSESTKFLEDFKEQRRRQEQQPKAPCPAQRVHDGPPIITYPEFLVEAHRPPPLITPSRLLNAAYIASGIAALVYGASKYLINPMVDTLTEARHDFSVHTQSNLNELNDRLSKMVSKMPEPKKESRAAVFEEDASEVESITSDPTELFHRDMGTQTSPNLSRRSSDDEISTTNLAEKRDVLTYQAKGLGIIREHLNEILLRIDKQEYSNNERQGNMNNLRHYLDTLMYASPAINIWSTGEDASSTKQKKDGQEDTIDELKKEIRNVKGVLLGARRFPAVVVASTRVGSATA